MEALRILMSKRRSDTFGTPSTSSKRNVVYTFQSDEERLEYLVRLTMDCAFQTIFPAMQRVFVKHNLWFNAGLLTDSYLIKSSFVCTALKFIITLNPVLYLYISLENLLLSVVYSKWGYGSISLTKQRDVLHLRYNIDVLASIEAGFRDVCPGYSQDPALAFVNPIDIQQLMKSLYSQFHQRVTLPNVHSLEFEEKALEYVLSKLRDSNTLFYTQFSTKYESTGKFLGRGAFGEVVEVRMNDKRQRGALKTTTTSLYAESGINAETVREIVLLRQFATGEHTNVIEVTDIAIHLNLDDNRIRVSYLMPLYATFSRVRRHYSEAFDSSKLIQSLSMQLLSGVAYLHDNNVIHGDLKPDNLLVEELFNYGLVMKIGDFNLSRIWKDQRFNDAYNGRFHDVVTLWYRSPELLLQKRPHPIVLHSSLDVWSVALIIIYMQNGIDWIQLDTNYKCLVEIFSRLGIPSPDNYLRSFSTFRARKYDSDTRITQPARDLHYFDRPYNHAGIDQQKALVRKMLAYDPIKRPSAQTCLFDVYYLDVVYWNQFSLR